jgi:MoaA/NifB/PqqE/SkfB family radical SAM enzyme
MEIIIGSVLRKIIPANSTAYRNIQYLYRYFLSVKRSRKLKLLNFSILLTDHCNLNCAGCGNYSPLAPERFYDIESFKKECKRISELTGRKISFMGFSGGEPLLHPNITEFFDVSRFYFDAGGGGGDESAS